MLTSFACGVVFVVFVTFVWISWRMVRRWWKWEKIRRWNRDAHAKRFFKWGGDV